MGFKGPKTLWAFDLDGTLIDNHLKDQPCPSCGGRGVYAGERCPDCKGRRTILVPDGDYGDVRVLPGRVATLAHLRACGGRIAICTNQGGVAFGYQSQKDVWRKLRLAGKELKLASDERWLKGVSVHVCFAHPQATLVALRDPLELHRRKPAPGMLEDAMEEHGVGREDTVFVGDLETDRQCAGAARVDYYDEAEFFDHVARELTSG